MMMPRGGALTAVSLMSAIDDPRRFRRSQDIWARLGLSLAATSWGGVDINARISKCGDGLARKLLFEAAHVMLSRTSRPSALKDWAAAAGGRSGF
ncbi:transposase [Sphingobium cloacae]|uniref:transposase n=1 Tax=Sphingobium cloacae TaxID=120107 RepID=UPI000BBB088C|nr:transposase [Sphingobium cloacae]